MIVLYYMYSKYFEFFSFFDEDDAGFTSMMALCLWMLMIVINMIALLMSFELLDPRFFYSKTVTGVILAIVLMVMNYFIFLRRKKYITIIDRFSNESNMAWILGAISVAVVTVLPFYLTFYHAVPYLIAVP